MAPIAHIDCLPVRTIEQIAAIAAAAACAVVDKRLPGLSAKAQGGAEDDEEHLDDWSLPEPSLPKVKNDWPAICVRPEHSLLARRPGDKFTPKLIEGNPYGTELVLDMTTYCDDACTHYAECAVSYTHLTLPTILRV